MIDLFSADVQKGENVSGSKEEAAKNWSLEDEFTYKDANMLGMCHGRFNKCISGVLARSQTHWTFDMI